jgi:CubicO group peptidase (beta-lactamase class C family)
MQDLNERVRSLLDNLIERDMESGLQVAAYLEGELVVDTWAGVADVSTRRPVDGNTLFCVFSTTKGITASVIHLLADRGQLDYDKPIAKYWPEFGVNGKDVITTRQVLTHNAGIPHMPEGVTPEDICDWEKMCRGFEKLSPLWKPGTMNVYHALSFGWILGELARRVDGRPIERIVQEDLCEPFGIDSLFFGIPDEAESRVAILENDPHPLPPPPPPPPPPEPVFPEITLDLLIPPSLQPLHEVMNRGEVRRAVLPAFGGIMNARSIARHYAVLACGELDGIGLLSQARIRIATELKFDQNGELVNDVMNRPLGYILGGPLSSLGNRLTAFGHGGMGGSLGFADTKYRFSFGLAKTRLVDRPPGQETAYLIAREIRSASGIPEEG